MPIETPSALTSPNRLDRVGAAASVVCAIHCALMPFLVAALPFVGVSFLASKPAEWAMVGISAAIGIVSIRWGIRIHGRRRAAASLVGGLSMVVIGRIAEDRGTGWGVPIVVLGALIIAASHVVNARLCKSCVACQSDCKAGNESPLT